MGLPDGAVGGDTVYPDGWTALHAAYIFARSPRWLQIIEQGAHGEPPIVPVRRFPLDWNASFVQTDARGQQSLKRDELRYYARTRGYDVLYYTSETFGTDDVVTVTIEEDTPEMLLRVKTRHVIPRTVRKRSP